MVSLPVVLFASLAWRQRVVALASPLSPVAIGLAWLGVIVLGGLSLMWLTVPGYFDHVETSTAAISFWYREGHPLYPAVDQGEGLYGLLYGPLLFQIIAAALSLSPTVLLTKVPGFLAFWLSVPVMAIALRPSLPAARLTMIPVAITLIVAAWWFVASWTRADPFLLLLAALALLCERRLNHGAAAFALGMLAGLCMNLKIHGVFYILPYIVGLLTDGWKSGAFPIRLVALCATGGMLGIVPPFLLPGVSPDHYLAFLRGASRHGLDGPTVLANLMLAAVLVTPVVPLLYRYVRGASRPPPWRGVAFTLSVLAVSILGGKLGSGPYHLLPFLPGFASMLVDVVSHDTAATDRVDTTGVILGLTLLVMLVAYLPANALSINDLRYRAAHVQNEQAARDELAEFYRSYPAAIMGVGGGSSYRLTYYRLVGIFSGSPIGIDLPAWMDLKLGGVPDKRVDRLLDACATPFWIVPKGGEPFTAHESYHDSPMFSALFRERFHARYESVRDGTYYSVWRCTDTASN
jgi:hypothetical protein